MSLPQYQISYCLLGNETFRQHTLGRKKILHNYIYWAIVPKVHNNQLKAESFAGSPKSKTQFSNL